MKLGRFSPRLVVQCSKGWRYIVLVNEITCTLSCSRPMRSRGLLQILVNIDDVGSTANWELILRIPTTAPRSCWMSSKIRSCSCRSGSFHSRFHDLGRVHPDTSLPSIKILVLLTGEQLLLYSYSIVECCWFVGFANPKMNSPNIEGLKDWHRWTGRTSSIAASSTSASASSTSELCSAVPSSNCLRRRFLSLTVRTSLVFVWLSIDFNSWASASSRLISLASFSNIPLPLSPNDFNFLNTSSNTSADIGSADGAVSLPVDLLFPVVPTNSFDTSFEAAITKLGGGSMLARSLKTPS